MEWNLSFCRLVISEKWARDGEGEEEGEEGEEEGELVAFERENE